jgi:putative peptidoglycan lipid II flippase
MSASLESSPQSTNRRIARAAGTVMIAFIISNLVGLIRGMVIYRTFGTGAELDSFNAANRVAELLFNLIAGGALGSAFIPVFTSFLTRRDTAGSWRLASGIINLLVVSLSTVTLLAVIFAVAVVENVLFVLNPGVNIGQVALTTHLLRILLPTIIIFGVSGILMGILNSHQQFWIPAIAPAMYSLGMIAGVLLLPESWGISRLAWGALIGSILHLVVQLPSIVRLKFAYKPAFFWKMAEVREVIRLFIPRIFGVAIVQLNFIVNTIIALSLPAGSASALVLAFSLMLMPEMAIAQSIAIAALPSFSAQVAEGKQVEMRASLAAVLRGVLLLSIPAMVGLILLREPLVSALYQRGGVFDERSTQMVAWALLWYSLGLVSHSLVEITSRAFYALHDTRTPVIVGAIAMTLNLGFSFLFTGLFERAGWMPLGGLALANTLATTLEMAALLILMRRRLQGLHSRAVLNAAGKAAIAALGMALALYFWLQYSDSLSDWLILFGGLIIGVLIYALLIWLLRVGEFQALVHAFRRRLTPKGTAG